MTWTVSLAIAIAVGAVLGARARWATVAVDREKRPDSARRPTASPLSG